jgi:hypothetical protein
MKRITLSTIILATALFSCKTNTETTNTDSLPADSVTSDTAEFAAGDEFLSEKPAATSDADQDDFDYTYEGLLNEKIKVRINIFQFQREQKARLVYLNSKKIINMDVRYPAVGTFELTEQIDGKSTGIWKLETKEEDILTGTWSSPDGGKQMPVQLG